MKGFKYDKFKTEAGGSDSWGSYSDLFMVLSFVFLMMYVVSSLRSGTNSIIQHLEQQKMNRENDDLRAQIKAYDTLKDQAVKEESQDEQQVYNELMDKLTLLQEEQTEEKNKLRLRAMENEKKAVALNKYQQVIRNIINANVLAKSKLKVREEIIDNKNEVIKDQDATITDLNSEIDNNNQEITEMNQELVKKIKALNKAQSQSKITKKKAIAQINALKKATESKVAQLKEQNEQVQNQLAQMNNQLEDTAEKLTMTESELIAQDAQNKKLSRDLASTNEKLEKSAGEFDEQIKNMQAVHSAKMAQDKAAFEGKLKAQKLSAEEKAMQLAAFNKKAKDQNDAMGKEIAGLKGDLAEAQARANARKKLSEDIAKALKKAGVDADVNANTGDVTIAFGKDYFDAGSSNLKKSMADVLKKFIPKYSESLFKDPKIASKITSVDIIGFASPTYKGKYINPQSLSPEDQKAAQYNLDLSYKRAKSIFDYMFDTKTITYQNQQDLLPLVNVTGKSFFTEGRAPAGATPGMSQKEFCAKFDCKQSQKVIIKFNMDDKK